MSLTIPWRSTALLALATAGAAPVQAGFVNGSPTWRDPSTVRPCQAGLTVTIQVGRPSTPPPTSAYAVEATLRVVDARNDTRVVTDGVALQNPYAILGLAWDGLVSSNGTTSPAAPGNVTATLDLTLVSLSPKAGGSTRTVVDTYRATTTARVVAASAVCAAWAAAGTAFARGEHRRVVINSRETTLLPRASWRGDRLVGLSGNLAAPAHADLGAVTDFIHAHPDLFGEMAAAQLKLESLGHDPTGITRLTASQRTRDGIRALDGRIVALFDRDNRLVSMTGPVMAGMYDLPFEFAVSDATALSNVVQELQRRGYDPSTRSITVLERVIAGPSPGLHGAYVIGVGPGPSARPTLTAGTVPLDTDWDTFVFVVSGQNGLFLDEWGHSSASAVQGTVNDVPMADPTYLDPLLAPSSRTPSAPPPRLVLSLPVWVNAPAAGADYFLLDDDRPGGVIDRVVAAVLQMASWGCPDVCWIETHWPTSDLAPWPSPPNPAFVPGFQTTLMRGFQIVQQQWDGHYAPWLGAQATLPVAVWSSTDLPGLAWGGGLIAGAYTVNDERGAIWLNPVDVWETPEHQEASALAAAHEVFHHFDEVTVGLRRRAGDDGHFMPTALKEGLAEFNGKAGFSPYPIDNTHHAQFAPTLSATVCSFSALLGNNYWVCFDDLHDRFRVHVVAFYPFHRPMLQGRSLLEPWADCRAWPWPLVDCHYALPRGMGGTFVWPGTTPTHASEYELIALTLLDAWESSTSAVASATNAATARTYGQTVFPNLVIGAFLTLAPDASFLDLRDALVMQVALDPSVTATLPASAAGVPVAEIEAAFDRHGIDAALRQYCGDAATQAYCH